MKIAVFDPSFLTPRPNAGSYLILLQNQAKAFAKLGNEVAVLAENRGQVQIQPEKKFTIHPLKGLLTKISPRFSMANNAISHFSGFFSPDIVQDAVKKLRNEIHPDIIYSCGTSFSSVFTALLGYLTGLPTVHYVFEFGGTWNWWRGDIDTMQGYDVPIGYLIRQFMKTLPRELVRRDFLHKWALRKVTKIVACSEYVKKALCDFSLDINDIQVVYPVLEIPPPQPSDSRNEDAQTITYFGHLWQGRGVLDLTMAFSKVILHHPAAKLVVASSNSHELTEYYFERMILEQGLSRNVLRKGTVRNSRQELLIPSSVIVIPYRDTPSMKLIESMAAAKPVITTRVGWTPELISDGVSGFLVDIGDVKKIADRLNLLLSDPELGRAIGKRARAVVMEKCSLTRNIARLVNILKETSCKSLN